MKNRICLKVIIFSIILALFIPLSTNAIRADSNTHQKVYDFAGILKEEEVDKLEAISNKYSAKRKTDIIILTTKDTNGKDTMKYMEDFYDEKALGYDKPHGNCAILTIDMKGRKVYLAGFYSAKESLDDSRLDIIRDQITPDLTKRNYYKAFKDFIEISYKYMGIRPGVNPKNIFFNLWFQIITSLVTAGIVVGIMAYSSKGKVTVDESTYLDFNNTKIIKKSDKFIRKTITKELKPSSNDNSSSSGSSGGGGGGVSSGGHSHSGSGGSF